MSSDLDTLFRKASRKGLWDRQTVDERVSTSVTTQIQERTVHPDRAASQILFAELEAVREIISRKAEPAQQIGPLALIDHIRVLCEADEPQRQAIQKAIRDLDDVLSIMNID